MKKILAALLAAALAVSSVVAVNAGTAPQRGDVNLDGKVDVVDATTVQSICAELGTFSDEQRFAADANGDGRVVVTDVTFIQMIVAEMVDPDEPQQDPIDPALVKAQGNAATCQFSAELLKNTFVSGSNTFISPLSVMEALAMTANGANGVTLVEMENTLGAKRRVLNDYFQAYPQYLYNPYGTKPYELPQRDRETGVITYLERQPAALRIANSLWYNNNGLHDKLNPAFVQDALTYYDAEVFATPFGEASCDALNGWVSEKTNHMIDKILDEMTPDELMVLANAIAFEADWAQPYDTYSLRKGVFTADNGETAPVTLMSSTEATYLSDGAYADGFLKYYAGCNYAFAALLPKQGVSLEDYVASLTGKRLEEALQPDDAYDEVHAYLPKFTLTYDAKLKDNLIDMGMTTAFRPAAANFRRMLDPEGTTFPYISEVLHKTFIDVNETGTSAAAVTVVVMKNPTSAPDEPEKKEITIRLDRPFVYMIVNTDTMTPIFIGAMSAIPAE